MDLKKTLANINKSKKPIKPFYLVSFGDIAWYMVIAVIDNYVTIENGGNNNFTFNYNDEKKRLKIDKGFYDFFIRKDLDFGTSILESSFEITPNFLELLKYKNTSFSLYMNDANNIDYLTKKIKEQLNQNYFL